MAWFSGSGPFGWFDGTRPDAEYHDYSCLTGRASEWGVQTWQPSQHIAASNPYYRSEVPGDGGQFGMLDFSSGQGQWHEIFAGDATRDPQYRPSHNRWGPAGYSGFGGLIDGIDGPGLGYRSTTSEWALAD